MKTTIFSGVMALFVATTAFAGDATVSDPIVTGPRAPVVSGSINVEATENSAGDWVAATTLGAGIEAEGLAFGSISVEAVDGEFELDGWMIGTRVGFATVSFGDQGDLFVGNDFEIVGGDTIANPAGGNESLIVETNFASVMVGLTDVTEDITDVSNLQGAATMDLGSGSLTGVVDYNMTSEEFTLGGKAAMALPGNINLGGIVTYAAATETIGYEASAGYGPVTGFVNGDDADMFQNVGAGVVYNWNGFDLYGEGAYNMDSEATTMGAGISFKF